MNKPLRSLSTYVGGVIGYFVQKSLFPATTCGFWQKVFNPIECSQAGFQGFLWLFLFVVVGGYLGYKYFGGKK